MSEAGAGTDVLGMKTTAVKKGDRKYVLNGQKMWITNGCVSDTELGDIFLVYAQQQQQQQQSGNKSKSKDLSMFIVEKGMPGFKLGQRIKDKCGMRASATAELLFEDCVVPAENLLGSEGSAVLHMMRNLEIERLALAGMALGIARRSFEVMNRYANQRNAFGKPISTFGQMQAHIANSYAEYMAGRAYTYHTAKQLNLTNAGQRADSDGVKLFTTTMAKTVADRAIQVLGGNGYIGEYQVERLWRDSKLLEIGGGTLEAHQKNIARDFSSLERLP
jgi:isovaleryl-CoA dehydrogenase